QAEHGRGGGGDERAEGGRRDLSQVAQEAHVVVRMFRGHARMEFKVADQQSKRFAARTTEFVFINLAEQLALIELDGALEIAFQFPAANVQHANLDIRRLLLVDTLDEILESAPRAFQLLKLRMVQNRVQLRVDQLVDQ